MACAVVLNIAVERREPEPEEEEHFEFEMEDKDEFFRREERNGVTAIWHKHILLKIIRCGQVINYAQLDNC